MKCWAWHMMLIILVEIGVLIPFSSHWSLVKPDQTSDEVWLMRVLLEFWLLIHEFGWSTIWLGTNQSNYCDSLNFQKRKNSLNHAWINYSFSNFPLNLSRYYSYHEQPHILEIYLISYKKKKEKKKKKCKKRKKKKITAKI